MGGFFISKNRKVIMSLTVERVLTDHMIAPERRDLFMGMQQRGVEKFNPHFAHHADVQLVKDPETGLLMIKKFFGQRKRIPYSVAEGLVEDYAVHEQRLKQMGVLTASNYGLDLQRRDDAGVISVKQLFFPQGTLMEWFGADVSSEDKKQAVAATVKDTLVPVVDFDHPSITKDQSWVFSDSAPKNVAPLKMEDEVRAYYFDLFVPRVRNANGTVKVYEGVNLHKRSEDEMQNRFFTKKGAVNNFLHKMVDSLGADHSELEIFFAVVGCEMRPFLDKLFPGLTPQEIAGLNFTLRNKDGR